MKHRGLSLFIGILLATSASHGETREKLRVGLSLREPFAFYDESGQLAGFDVELLKVMSSLSGWEIEWHPMDINELIPSIRSGKIDVIAGGFYVTEERKKSLRYTRPYAQSGLVMVAREDSRISSPPDLDGKTIGIVQGSAGDFWLKSARRSLGGVKVVYFPDPESALNALLSGKLDVAIDDYVHALYFWHTKALGKLKIVGEPYFLTRHDIALAVGRKRPELAEQLDENLRELMKSPLYEKLYNKWFLLKSPYHAEQFVRKALTASGIVFLILFVILFLYLYGRERKAKEELHRITKGTALAFATAVELKTPYLRGHSERVAEYARRIAARFGRDNELLYLAAILHDVGKIMIPDALMEKPGRLSEDELELIRKHPEVSYLIVKELIPAKDVALWIKAHHERWDGTGYPLGLKGEEIPLEARIIAVADAFDAMTTEKPYREPLSEEEALKRLREGAGTQWDPEVVDVALKTLHRIEKRPELDSFYTVIDRIKNTTCYTTLRLRVLYRIGEEIRNLVNLDRFLHNVLKIVKEVVPADVKLALVLKEKDDLIVRAQVGMPPDVIGIKLPRDRGITRWAYEHCEPVIVNDVEKDPRYFAPHGQEKIGSEMAVPLVVGDKVIGVLDVETTEKNAFTPEDLAFFQMVTTAIAGAIETARLYHEREVAALYDSLTGARSFRYLLDIFGDEKEKAEKRKTPMSIVFIDANGLKSINDNYGHKAGDEGLKAFVRGLEENLRSTDILARYGGDEFVILMPMTDSEEAQRIMERIKEDLSTRYFEVDGIKIPFIEFAYGISEYPSEGTDLEELIKLADRRMYADKNVSRIN